MVPLSSFHYFVVAKSSRGRVSVFQAFDWAWIEHTGLFADILRLPANLRDVIDDRYDLVRLRALGYSRRSLALVDVAALDSIKGIPFVVLVSTEDTLPACDAYCASQPYPTLHITSVDGYDVPTLQSISLGDYDSWLDEIGKYHALTGDPAADDLAIILSRRKLDRGEITGDVSASTSADCANRCALASARIEQPALDDCATICSAGYDAVKQARARHFDRAKDYGPGSTELLIAIPGLARVLPAVLPAAFRASVSDAEARAYRSIRAGAMVGPDFEQAALDLTGTLDPGAVRICRERAAELHAFMIAVCIEASSQCIPTIECPSPYRAISAQLVSLNEQLRFGNATPEEINGATATIGQRLAAALPAEVNEEISNVSGTIKLLTDDPIEFLQVKGNPLPVHAAVVRVPITPGILLQSQIRLATPTIMTPRDFQEVLVVRGTAPSDPTYEILEWFCDDLSKVSSGTSVRVIDVNSIDGFTEALDGFSGAVAIFDGHGIHAAREPGKLIIRDQTVSTLELSGLKMPPIVVLSACDTHSAIRHQDSTAAAILLAGAKTVVGTLATIGAIESARFVTRLLLGVATIIPLYPTPVRWSEFFAAVQRAEHVLSGLGALDRAGAMQLPRSEFVRIAKLAERLIYAFDRQWFDVVQKEIAVAAAISVHEVLEAWNKHSYYSDALLHCQLGGADVIYLTPSEEFFDERARLQGFPDRVK